MSANPRARHPLILRWHDALPHRAIRSLRRERPLAWFETSSSLHGDERADDTFDFCAAVRDLMTDIVLSCADFRHLDVTRILVSVTQAREACAHGLQARVTPLRFAGGVLTRQRRGVPFRIQRYFFGEREYLYLLTFVLPRYLDQDFDQKLVTLFHELYHIGPLCDGDLRRHAGRYQYHSHSKHEYDDRMVHCARAYLAGKPDGSLLAFLRLNFLQLQERHGAVTGIVVPRPKMIPLVGPHAPATATT